MRIYYNLKLKSLSRTLRKNSTLSEVLLWNQLKGRKILGCQFSRQKPIKNYIVDFYCSKLKLVIEIDGNTHLGNFKKDELRERELTSIGLNILRFSDLDVKKNLSGVVTSIYNWIEHNPG